MSIVNNSKVNIATAGLRIGKDADLGPYRTDSTNTPTSPEIAYQMVKDETFPQTQPRLKSGYIRHYLHG